VFVEPQSLLDCSYVNVTVPVTSNHLHAAVVVSKREMENESTMLNGGKLFQTFTLLKTSTLHSSTGYLRCETSPKKAQRMFISSNLEGTEGLRMK
jgi:hypothetical protein